MAADEETRSFIRATFRSVWALELLCYLRRNGDADHSPSQMIEGLRASDAVIRQGLSGLLAAGLVVVNDDGSARYLPATSELDRRARAAEALYGKSPDAVRRLIVAAANPGLAAFSDAFKLRQDE
jgi:hypothetical protein